MNLSLRVRSLLLALSALIIFIPAAVFTMDRAYVSSLQQAKYDELKLMSLAMITEFEFDEGLPVMPFQLFEEQLNLPGSGYMAYITWQDNVVWRSLSTLDYQDPQTSPVPAVGAETFATLDLPMLTTSERDELPFYYAFSAEYDNNGEFTPVTFMVLNEQADFQQERQMFLTTLIQWLLLLSIGLLGLILLITRRILAPVTSIIKNVEAAEQGEIERLKDSYPPELESLKHSINQLLETEAQQRERYKNSLGDLAHSLKTPLAVMMSDQELPDSAHEPLSQIDNIIKRQLKRAVTDNQKRFSATDVNQIVKKLLGAMRKVYADKQLLIEDRILHEVEYRGDETDIMELLGNLIDNACKSAKTQVRVSAQFFDRSLHIYVEDDGEGIASDQAEKILTRGNRLDTYQEGQGIGLSVLIDLLESYNGQLRIDRSPMGGARFTVLLP